MVEQLAPFEDSVPAYPVQNAQAGQADYLSMWAGQGVAAARPLPAAELMALLEKEWRAVGAVLAAAAALRG